MRRLAPSLALAALLLTSCRSCSTSTNDAPTAEPSASASSAVSADPPSGRPMGSTLVPGSWKKGSVPPVVPPATSSTVK